MPRAVETDPATISGEPAISPLAGKPALKEMLIDVARLEGDYFERKPDVRDAKQLVTFGTSGHRGSPFHATFTEAHILAITQAICEHRRSEWEGEQCRRIKTCLRLWEEVDETRSRTAYAGQIDSKYSDLQKGRRIWQHEQKQ